TVRGRSGRGSWSHWAWQPSQWLHRSAAKPPPMASENHCLLGRFRARTFRAALLLCWEYNQQSPADGVCDIFEPGRGQVRGSTVMLLGRLFESLAAAEGHRSLAMGAILGLPNAHL